jgi:hypothetical protein
MTFAVGYENSASALLRGLQRTECRGEPTE